MEPLAREQAFDLLGREPVAHLGVILDGEPWVYPMSFVVDGDRILFRTLAGAKLDAIRANPRVCVEVSSFDAETGNWESAIVRGTARFVDSDQDRQSVIAQLFDKYATVMGSPMSAGGGLMPLGGQPYVIEVPIEEISGMSSDGGFRIRTKPGRL
jgi:hypothetical protein